MIQPVKKPSRRKKRPRKFNSTLPVVADAKRRPKKPLPASNRPRRSKGLKKVNPERQAKRRKAYAQKLAAYRRSETYRLVEARAGNRCEHFTYTTTLTMLGDKQHPDFPPVYGIVRCCTHRAEGTTLTHHHKTYARFGGKELPEDIIVLCDRHNAEAESKYPTRNRGWSRWQARTA